MPLMHACGRQGEDRLRDLVAIEPVVVLNAGFCERHMRHCPASQQLQTVCAQARRCMLPQCMQASRLLVPSQLL